MSLPRVLLVDDERDNIDALKRLLRRDFEIFSALSGEEGLAMITQHAPFDAIVSDQRMPGMQGSELLEKAQDLDPIATRILLTGFSDIEAVVDAVNRGQIWRYISKPWEPEDLKVTVRQATERSRMSRSLEASRRELEKAINELRAKDWARERLMQVLLHEFRTAPQILQGLKALDPGGADADSRLRFIESLESRFLKIETDLKSLMEEEKSIAALPKTPVDLGGLLQQLASRLSIPAPSMKASPKILTHAETWLSSMSHLYGALEQNSQKAKPNLIVEWSNPSSRDAFVVFAIEGPTVPLPDALASAKGLEPAAAWTALLEPFVGLEDFTRHSSGLRVETARFVRTLAALGGKAEFQVSGKPARVELLVGFRTFES